MCRSYSLQRRMLSPCDLLGSVVFACYQLMCLLYRHVQICCDGKVSCFYRRIIFLSLLRFLGSRLLHLEPKPKQPMSLCCVRTVEMLRWFLVVRDLVEPWCLVLVTMQLRFAISMDAILLVLFGICWVLLAHYVLHFLSFEQPGEEPCPIDPWIVVPDKSKYVDQQTLKLQENPEVCFLIQDLFLSFGYPTIVHLCFQIYYELLFMM